MRGGRWLRILGGSFLVAVVAYVALLTGFYVTTPRGNTKRERFDTIIVLGTPSLADGSPSPEQRERVVEGVEEYRRGVAQHVIMTGGAAHNHFVEAHSMALLAESMGVPAEAVIEEGKAHDTIQNVFYSLAIMRQHGWGSAEVVSSPSHLPRTGLILSRWPIEWRTHAAKWPAEYGWVYKAVFYWSEASKCWLIRLHGFKPNRFVPGS